MSETIDLKLKEFWEKAIGIYLSTLQSPEEKNQVERYLSMITSVTGSGNHYVVYTGSKFSADFLRENYGDRLKTCLDLVSGSNDIALEFTYDDTIHQTVVTPKEAEASKTRTEKISTFCSTLPLKEEYTFDEFVRGTSNSWAFASAQGVVANPGKGGYNPLFIHGGTGLGKTHLMQAIGNELKRKNPSLAICYLTAETFLNEYVNSLKNGEVESFRHRYRNVDVLLVDDVQFLQQGKQCQTEFFNTFNALRDHDKQIVMTSDVAPKNLPSIEERLISRFEGGMVQEIESPNYETRLAILRKKSEAYNPSIPDNALQFIADTIKSHVRAMEGALRKVGVFRAIDPAKELSNEVLTYILKDFIEKEKTRDKLTIEMIQTAVAKKYSVTISQILSPERTQSIVTPRQLAMYISRKFTNNSLPEIALKFDKTHATIIHGVRNIEKRLDVEEDLRSILSEILGEFGYKMSDKMD